MAYQRLKITAICLLMVLFTAILGWEQPVRAHAEYERSDPAADAILPAAPAEVHIWFSQELFRRAGANVIEVIGPAGSRVDHGETRIDDDDRTHMMVLLQPGLPAGEYTVRWRNLSVDDGHEGGGEFSFTVAPGVVESAPQASPTPGPQPAADTPAPTSTPTAIPPIEPAAPAPAGSACVGGMLLGGLLLLTTIPERDRRWKR